MAVYKAVLDAAEEAEERLGTFRRMIARKEAQRAEKEKQTQKNKYKAKIKAKAAP